MLLSTTTSVETPPPEREIVPHSVWDSATPAIELRRTTCQRVNGPGYEEALQTSFDVIPSFSEIPFDRSMWLPVYSAIHIGCGPLAPYPTWFISLPLGGRAYEQ